MKKKKSILYFLFFSAALSMAACSHYDQIQQDVKESEAGDDESHNFGQNCGSCHNANGNEAVLEAGWWTISGSVYKDASHPLTEGRVELWEKPDSLGGGKLLKQLDIDKNGNFYTNQIIDFNGGCYPKVVSGSKSKSMKPVFNLSSCNSCHGISTLKITLN